MLIPYTFSIYNLIQLFTKLIKIIIIQSLIQSLLYILVIELVVVITLRFAVNLILIVLRFGQVLMLQV
jgi:hypothetical protein